MYSGRSDLLKIRLRPPNLRVAQLNRFRLQCRASLCNVPEGAAHDCCDEVSLPTLPGHCSCCAGPSNQRSPEAIVRGVGWFGGAASRGSGFRQ